MQILTIFQGNFAFFPALFRALCHLCVQVALLINHNVSVCNTKVLSTFLSKKRDINLFSTLKRLEYVDVVNLEYFVLFMIKNTNCPYLFLFDDHCIQCCQQKCHQTKPVGICVADLLPNLRAPVFCGSKVAQLCGLVAVLATLMATLNAYLLLANTT